MRSLRGAVACLATTIDRSRRSFAPALWIATAAVALSSASQAGPPNPGASEVILTGQSYGCHYRFGAAPGCGDTLTATLLLRNAFNLPSTGCAVSIELVPNEGTVAFCSCCPPIAEGVTNASGVFQATFSGLGGYGSLDVVSYQHCVGTYLISVDTIEFTSQDLNASCEASNSTNLFDLAAFAGVLAPSFEWYGDYDCNDVVNVFDLGFFATGLGVGCGAATCP